MRETVLVTGGSGFIGRHCLTPLVEKGVKVIAIGRTPPLLEGQVTFVECDLLDAKARSDAVASVGASRLLHLAWDLKPGEYAESASNLDWLAASLGLVREFSDAGGFRVVIAGSCFEYKWGPPTLAENSELAPATFYGQSKDALRRVLDAYSQRRGPELSWARLFFLYGPGENRQRLAGAVSSALLRGSRVETSEGTQRRDYMYVADVGKALAALTLSSLTGSINVASGHGIQVKDLVNGIAREVGRADLVEFGARSMSEQEPDVVQADTTRLRGELGFDSFTPLDVGIRETVDWWRGEVHV